MTTHGRRSRPWVARTAVVATAALAALGIVEVVRSRGPAARTARAPLARGAPPDARVTVTGVARRIPGSFLGLAVSDNEIGRYEREGALFDRVVSLIRPSRREPVVLRVGGRAADHVYWDATRAARPRYVSLIGAGWMARLTSAANRDNLRVVLDANLAVHAPALAAAFATAARDALGTRRLAGVAIGNEPDLYFAQPDLVRQRIPGTDVGTHWIDHYGPAAYRRDYRNYARAVHAAVPDVPLAGPETLFSPDPSWLSAVQRLGPLSPRILTIHRYVADGCAAPGSRDYPTTATMLAPAASAGVGASVAAPVADARAHGQSVQVTELNSISCGGTPGVSDSFATALWAPDVLFGLLRAGVDGVNWQTRPETVNAPFRARLRSISARPSLYGLALFAQIARPGAALMNVTMTAARRLHLTAWAVRQPGVTRVLLIDKGPRAAHVLVTTGAAGRAYLQRLSAPRIRSTGQVTLGGRAIGPDARWHGRRDARAVSDAGGRSSVTVPRFSAALLTVRRGR